MLQYYVQVLHIEIAYLKSCNNNQLQMIPADGVLLMKFILVFGEGNFVTEKTAQCRKTASCRWLLLTKLYMFQLDPEGPEYHPRYQVGQIGDLEVSKEKQFREDTGNAYNEET